MLNRLGPNLDRNEARLLEQRRHLLSAVAASPIVDCGQLDDLGACCLQLVIPDGARPGLRLRPPHVTVPTEPPGCNTRFTSARHCSGDGRWKRTKATIATSKRLAGSASLCTSMSASGHECLSLARRSMPCERSMPTMTALGAARWIAGNNAPAPVPMSMTWLVLPDNGSRAIRRSPTGRMIGLQSPS